VVFLYRHQSLNAFRPKMGEEQRAG